MRLLVDCGHGIGTLGKRSPDGRLREYLYVREIGAKVVEYFQTLTDYNIPVHLIVPEETDIPLKQRVERVNNIVNSYPSDQCLLLSIHVNAAGMGKEWMSARGWSVFVSKNSSYNSKVLANNFYDAAKELGAKIRVPLPTQKYWESNLYILKHTLCPAVLTENFFQDNREDVDMLLSPKGRNLVENIQIMGISKYLGIPYALVLPQDS